MQIEDDSVLMELECLICREYLYPPILLCRTGHSMCENCRRRLTICPICDAAIGNARNFTLESLISKFKLPCKYKDEGCSVVETGDKLRMHEEFCEHGEIRCPLYESAKCPWTGKPGDLAIHAANNNLHLPSIINNREHCMQGLFRILGNKKWYSLVNANCKTFKYCFNINSNRIVRWNVQYVGPREDASNYAYIIAIIDKKKKKEQYSIMSTCEPLGNDNQSFTSGTCISFNKLQQFCDADDNLHFYFKIVGTKVIDCLLNGQIKNTEEEVASKHKKPRLNNESISDTKPESKECVYLKLSNPLFYDSSDVESA